MSEIEVMAWKFWIIITAIIGTVVVIISCASMELDKEYIKAGYTKATIQGSDYVTWVKPQ